VPELKSDPTVTRQHLHHITRRWGEIGLPCALELVFLSADDRATVKDVLRVAPTPEGIEQAVLHAAAMNAHNIGAYATVNPIDARRQLRAGHRATAADMLCSFYHWGDCDTAEAAENEWLKKARFCDVNSELLTNPREQEFVADMAIKLKYRTEPTEKQAAWLDSIYARLVRQTRASA